MGKVIEILVAKHPQGGCGGPRCGGGRAGLLRVPEAHKRQIRSTNPLERINKERRKRIRVVGIFPNEAAALRLLTMILVEQHDEWAVGRHYFSANSMKQLHTEPDPVALEDQLAAT